MNKFTKLCLSLSLFAVSLLQAQANTAAISPSTKVSHGNTSKSSEKNHTGKDAKAADTAKDNADKDNKDEDDEDNKDEDNQCHNAVKSAFGKIQLTPNTSVIFSGKMEGVVGANIIKFGQNDAEAAEAAEASTEAKFNSTSSLSKAEFGVKFEANQIALDVILQLKNQRLSVKKFAAILSMCNQCVISVGVQKSLFDMVSGVYNPTGLKMDFVTNSAFSKNIHSVLNLSEAARLNEQALSIVAQYGKIINYNCVKSINSAETGMVAAVAGSFGGIMAQGKSVDGEELIKDVHSFGSIEAMLGSTIRNGDALFSFFVNGAYNHIKNAEELQLESPITVSAVARLDYNGMFVAVKGATSFKALGCYISENAADSLNPDEQQVLSPYGIFADNVGITTGYATNDYSVALGYLIGWLSISDNNIMLHIISLVGLYNINDNAKIGLTAGFACTAYSNKDVSVNKSAFAGAILSVQF